MSFSPAVLFPSPLAPVQAAQLQRLIDQGEAVLTTKTMPKGRIVGDWQSVETVYAIVALEPFAAWKAEVLAFLQALAPDDALKAHDLQALFLSQCARAQYLEALEGVKQLKRWQAQQ